MSLYRVFFRSLISRVDPERAHRLALDALTLAQRAPGGRTALGVLAPTRDERLEVRAFGRTFANPLGVAAGLDKEAQAVDALLALGFGHVEVGTVTLRPQEGNPRPRLWRLTEQRAVINAMGFPSSGVGTVIGRLQRATGPGVVGINIGKNRQTTLEAAADDYEALVRELEGCGDYLAINVSSPNTPGLRRLQAVDQLTGLLRRTLAAAGRLPAPPPVLVKLSPDVADDELDEIAVAAVDLGVAGIIATNTTVDRAGLRAADRERPGGLSGPPLRRRADAVARRLYRRLEGRLPIIGVGGIGSASDLLHRVRSGASLVQLYTAMIYEGPALAGRILRDLAADADRNGWRSIGDLVGLDAG
jgi:dihydroorotate dehydrogenase